MFGLAAHGLYPMNVWLLCVISLARALVVAAVTRAVAQPFCQWFKQAAPHRRRMARWLASTAVGGASLLAAYVYSPWDLWAFHGPHIGNWRICCCSMARAFPIYVIGE